MPTIKRRELLSGGLGAVFGGSAVRVALEVWPLDSSDGSAPTAYRDDPITYERAPLQVRAPTDTVRRGDEITFEITHTGNSGSILLGCHVPWAIQEYDDGTWRHVVMTDQRMLLACASMITPGETITQTVPLSASELANSSGISDEEAADVTFEPGKYRFVVFSDPPLAVNFSVRAQP